MIISAKIVLDSINGTTSDRLTTFVICIPKWLLAELNTHRSLSKNAASSRAIPAKKVRSSVLQNPFIPIHFGRSGKGMQSHGELSQTKTWLVRQAWLAARYPAIFFHWLMGDILGLTKQLVNRILEPWMWANVQITATEWKNFYALRCHKDAQPEFQYVAKLMRRLHEESKPQVLEPGEWHLPWVNTEEKKLLSLDQLKQISAARSARISYQLPEGGISSLERDFKLCNQLKEPPLHASPFEHSAKALDSSLRMGNFIGWMQQRKEFENESGGDYLFYHG